MSKEEIESLIKDFIEVCALSSIKFSQDEIEVEILPAGDLHVPGKLPMGYMAVYIFMQDNTCFKVGKVGAKSNARYQLHHYNAGSSQSNLAKSLLDDEYFHSISEVQSNVGNWIKQNTTRINLLISSEQTIFLLNLLEAFVQCRLKPIYEGYKSQNLIKIKGR